MVSLSFIVSLLKTLVFEVYVDLYWIFLKSKFILTTAVSNTFPTETAIDSLIISLAVSAFDVGSGFSFLQFKNNTDNKRIDKYFIFKI